LSKDTKGVTIKGCHVPGVEPSWWTFRNRCHNLTCMNASSPFGGGSMVRQGGPWSWASLLAILRHWEKSRAYHDFFGGEEKAVRYMCFKPPPNCSPEDTPCCQIS